MNPGREMVLLRAEAMYVSDSRRRSLDYWYAQWAASTMSREEFLDHAREHGWALRRQSFWKGVQAAWLGNARQQLLLQRGAVIADLVEVRGHMLQLLRPIQGPEGMEWPVPPKSFEGVARALVQGERLLEAQRKAALTEMEAQIGEAADAEAGQVEIFAADERRMIARTLVQARRRARHLELGIHDETLAGEHEGLEDGPGGDIAGVEGEERAGQRDGAVAVNSGAGADSPDSVPGDGRR